MRNTQENFPNVPIENLSDLQVKSKATGELFDVTEHFIDESFTRVSFNGETVQFTPKAGEQVSNDEYEVVFKYGGEPFVDFNGSK